MTLFVLFIDHSHIKTTYLFIILQSEQQDTMIPSKESTPQQQISPSIIQEYLTVIKSLRQALAEKQKQNQEQQIVWQKQLQKAEERLTIKEEENNKMLKEIDQLKANNTAKTNKISTLQRSLLQVKTQLRTARNELDTLSDRAVDIMTDYCTNNTKEIQQKYKNYIDENVTLKRRVKDIEGLVRDCDEFIDKQAQLYEVMYREQALEEYKPIEAEKIQKLENIIIELMKTDKEKKGRVIRNQHVQVEEAHEEKEPEKEEPKREVQQMKEAKVIISRLEEELSILKAKSQKEAQHLNSKIKALQKQLQLKDSH